MDLTYAVLATVTIRVLIKLQNQNNSAIRTHYAVASQSVNLTQYKDL